MLQIFCKIRLRIKNVKTYNWILYALLAIFFAAAIIQIIWGIEKDPVKIWDEAVTAQSAIAMLENKDFLVVYYYGEPDHLNTRPPLAVWVKVISYALFGINTFSVRLPSIIASILLIFLILYFYRKHFKEHLFYSLITLIIIACTSGFMNYHVARTGDPDALLTFFIAFYSIAFFLLVEYFPLNRNKYYLLFGAGIIFAFYTKSIAGLSPLAGLGLYMLTQKNGRKILKDYRFYIASVIVFIVSFSYYPLREVFDPGFIESVLENEFGIINEPVIIKYPSKLFYWNYLHNDAFKPFFYFLPFVLIPMAFSSKPKVRRLLLFAFIAAAVFVIGNSMVTLKNRWYIAPVYPYLWLLAGVGFAEVAIMLSKFIKQEWKRRMIYTLFVIFFAVLWFPYYKSIFLRNNTNPHNYIYEPERAGIFLEHVKENLPELNDFIVVTKHNTRQMNFYAEKYRFLDSTKISFVRKIHQADTAAHIIICDSTIWKVFEKQLRVQIIEKGKYCRLYEVK